MALSSNIQLTIGDTALAVNIWDQYDVVLDLWKPGSPFVFSVPKSTGNQSTWQRVKAALKFGAIAKLSIDDSVQFTGKIEDIASSKARSGAKLSFAGRDLGGAAIDWDASPMVQLRGLTLADALAAIFAPLGIVVRIGASVDDTRRVQVGTTHNARAIATTRRTNHVDRGRPQPGERIWQLAERICARFGYIIWLAPDADGSMSVIVDVPNYTSGSIFDFRYVRQNGRVTSDSNILDSLHRISSRNVPTSVDVYTNAAMGASASPNMAAHVENFWIFNPDVMGGYESDPSIVQPRHIRAQEARTLDAAQREAQRTISMANANSRRYTCTVQGHYQPFGSGRLHYALNCLAHVRDDDEGIDEDMLIERVHFTGTRKGGGQRTEITMHAKGAVVLVPDTTGTAAGSSGATDTTVPEDITAPQAARDLDIYYSLSLGRSAATISRYQRALGVPRTGVVDPITVSTMAGAGWPLGHVNDGTAP